MNPAQKQSLEVGLALIEEGLLEIEAWLTETPRQGRLVRTLSDLSPHLRRELREGIQAASALLAGLAEVLGLDPRVRSITDLTFGRLPVLWQIARECRAQNLRGYGPVPPDLPEALDPIVDALSELLWGLFRLVAAERGAAPAG